MRQKALVLTLLVILSVWILPGAAWAQGLGAIAGEVSDTTGAVLPGVTVEVTSPAMIEGTRSVVTDGGGRYSVESLRPGTYAVTFTLTGFSVVKREGVMLTAGFTAPVNAQLKVGSLEETVTVTGASPTVDVRNVRTQSVLDEETLKAIPAAQNLTGFANLTLGMTTTSPYGQVNSDVGGSAGEVGSASLHFNRAEDMKVTLEGMSVNQSRGSNGGTMHTFSKPNMEAVSETVLGTNGMSAETETAGLSINYIPKDGGNRLSLSGRLEYATESFQSSNLTDELRARGASTPSTVKVIYDRGFGVGGPVKKDHVWFFTSHRWWDNEQYSPGTFINGSQGQKAPNGRPLYTPDLSRRGFVYQPTHDHTVRLTWQATGKDKLAYYGNLEIAEQNRPPSTAVAPEAVLSPGARVNLTQVTWSRTQSSRLLFEGGLTFALIHLHFAEAPGVSTNDYSMIELSPAFRYNSMASAGGTSYNASTPNNESQTNGRGSLSYITGSHSFKVGGSWMHGLFVQNGSNNPMPNFGPVAVTTNRGVPTSLTLYAMPESNRSDYRNVAFYAQDQWAVKKLTVNLGLRADLFNGWNPEQDSPANVFVQGIHFAEVDNIPKWRDVSPRLGVAYDLRGDGKTAFKAQAGRYVSAQGSGIVVSMNPANTISKSTTRTWTDANDNFFPDGDPRNPLANGELGPSANAAFGTPVTTSFFAPDFMSANRPYTWQMSGSAERELRANMRLAVSYFHTQHFNQTLIDNESVAPADYNPYCVTVAANAALPGGGGNQLCGLADISAAARARVPRNVTKNAEANFGKQTEAFNGVDMELSTKFGDGGMFRGGVSLGRSVNDRCFVADSPQELFHCHVVIPMWDGNGQLKFSGTYPLPLGLELSGVFTNVAGPARQATATFVNAAVAPSLGRNLSSCATATGACTATVAVDLLQPYTLFEKRVNQLDFRLAKVLKGPFGRIRATLDLYNALNVSGILAVNNGFGTDGTGWGNVTALLPGRMLKLGAQLTF